MEKIYFVSLGCDKNLVDSEKMLGTLNSRGYSFTDEEEAADIAVVNTCCFIKDAQKESIGSILELAKRRAAGDLKGLIVAGCLAQRYRGEILKEIPEVDAVIGTTATAEIADTVDTILGKHTGPGNADGTKSGSGHAENGPAGASNSGEDQAEAVFDPDSRVHLESLSKPENAEGERILTTGGHIGYLKIAEGCNKCCTYCVIPSVRGPYRSVPMENLILEAGKLAAEGVKELILVAQETTVYGVDLYGKKMLPELLKKLCQINGIAWIRLLYCYPEEITEELIDTMAEEPKILHYLDMPVQHASDNILRRMNRRTNRKELEEKIAMIREKIPDICLRTTLISGFPGETDTDHRHLVAFVRKEKFDRLGVFTYSREQGTPAAAMKPQIPQKVKKARQKEIMLVQQDIAFRKARRRKGNVMTAIVEGRLDPLDAGETADPGAYVYTARTYMDAPDIDGLLFFESRRELLTGDFVRVKITGSQDYDLTGTLIEKIGE